MPAEGEEGPTEGPGGILIPPEPGGTTPAAQPISPTPGGMPEVSNERSPIQPPGGRSSMSKVIDEEDGKLIERINRPKNAKKISLIRDDILPDKEEDDKISNEDETE